MIRVAAAALIAAFTLGCASQPTRPATVNHPVFITLNDPADATAFIADCDRLLPTIPGVISYYCGLPLDTERDTVDAGYDVGLYVGFNTVDDYAVYVAHPNHVELVTTWKSRTRLLLVRDILDETP
jgi:hypothetical protein